MEKKKRQGTFRKVPWTFLPAKGGTAAAVPPIGSSLRGTKDEGRGTKDEGRKTRDESRGTRESGSLCEGCKAGMQESF